MEQFSFTLPMPPSANRYWRNLAEHRVVLSQEAKDYKDTAAWMARIAGVAVLHGHVKLTLNVFGLRKNADLNNRIKVLEDALNGICWVDDNQIIETHVYRELRKVQEPRVEVTVEEVPVKEFVR